MSKLKQKHIEQFLQDIQDFQYGQKSKINLEQHMTPPDLASKLLFHIYQNQQVEDYIVMDLGTGTGMLTCGLIYIGALHTIGVEIDEKYVRVTQQQLDQKVDGASYELLNANIAQLKIRQKTIDMLVMNPPFGTKQQGIDMKFLQFGMKVCKGNIYSMHKSSTRNYINKFCSQRNYRMQTLYSVKFPLKKRFKNYHKKEVQFTQVDILQISPLKKQS